MQIFQALTKWATLVTESSAIAGTLVQAWIRATSGCPGPVLVDLTRSALEGHVAGAALPALLPTFRTARTADRGAVARAAAVLREARAPLMWLGNGAWLAGAGETALDPADGCPNGMLGSAGAWRACPPTMGPRTCCGPRKREAFSKCAWESTRWWHL